MFSCIVANAQGQFVHFHCISLCFYVLILTATWLFYLTNDVIGPLNWYFQQILIHLSSPAEVLIIHVLSIHSVFKHVMKPSQF